MINIDGEIYKIQIDTKAIAIYSERIPSLPRIDITAYPSESFSLFLLGPVIANEIKIEIEECTIGTEKYQHMFMEVYQDKGISIEFRIKNQRAIPDAPIDSGDVVYVLKDYIVKQEY